MPPLALTPAVRRFWAGFLTKLDDPADAERRLYDVFRIGARPESADSGARLIMAGVKTSTSSLLWEYEENGMPAPEVGALSILLDSAAAPVCVVETVWVEVIPFDRVDAQFAHDYGEWDRTLATWRRNSWAYYEAYCERLTRTPRPNMPLVCERFRVIYPT